MRTVPLIASASVTLSGGTGTASLGPQFPRVTWRPGLIAVSCSTNTLEAQCYVYRGAASPGNLIAATGSGSTGDSDAIDGVELHCGQVITATWTGGDASAVATISVTGTQDIPG